MKEIKTLDGAIFPVVSSTKMLGIVIIDLLAATVTISFIVELMAFLGVKFPEWVSAVFGLLIYLYAFLAYRDVVKSAGRWSHGIIRCPCSKIEGYSDKGALFINDELPKTVLSKRAMILIVYFGIMILLMTVMQKYSG